jgi:hypothetical protein
MKTILAAMLIAAALPAAAQKEKKFGDWITDYSLKGFQIASTSNPSGSTTGIICNLEKEGCDAFIVMGLDCDNGEAYPMMLSTAVGAASLSSKCLHIGKMQILVIDEFSAMVGAFESGSEIGFALPMKGGQFRVSRFSTAGAVPALKEARTPPPSKNKKSKLGDQTL